MKKLLDKLERNGRAYYEEHKAMAYLLAFCIIVALVLSIRFIGSILVTLVVALAMILCATIIVVSIIDDMKKK